MMEAVIEVLKGMVLAVFAVLKNIGNFILGLGFPMNVIVIVGICVVFFIIYQASEHYITSSITRLMISAIVVIGIAFGLITFIL